MSRPARLFVVEKKGFRMPAGNNFSLNNKKEEIMRIQVLD